MDENDYVMHKRAGYADPSPYPKVDVAEPNPYYLQLIMDDYAGATSEYTAISQYLYHYFVTKDEKKELAELFENISITEMLHMEILAELIIQLGGEPVYMGGPSIMGNWWCGNLVYYGCSLCDRLHADLQAEYQAIETYEENIRVIQDKNIQKVLARIILDEKVHVKLFKEAIAKYCH
jgi:bacterioferritin